MADQPRTARTQTTRETESRPTTWRPPELLPMPDIQEGWRFRWIRVASLGEIDTTNTGMRRREGWEFVDPSDMPEIALDAGCRPEDTRIEIGGLALAKIPEEVAKQRDEYFTRMATAQLEAVDQSLMRQQDPRMPIIRERKSSTSYG